MVAWTTTPWTLPSNLALCVNPDKDYVKVRDKESGAIYILMEARICELYKDAEAYEVIGKFKGKTLEGKSYEPLFEYFASMKSRGAFKVLIDGYVTEDSGTGVVHQAPGETTSEIQRHPNLHVMGSWILRACTFDLFVM